MKKRWLVAGAALAAGGMLAAGYAVTRDTTPPDHGSVIARVDGVPIYSEYAQTRLESVTSGHEGFDVDLADEWKPQVLQSLVDDVIVRREAEQRDIEVTGADVDAEVQRVRSMAGEEDDFDSWLKEQGMTLAELERRAENRLRWGRVQDAVIGEIAVSNEEIKAYYDKHLADFTSAAGTRELFEVKSSIEEKLVAEKGSAAFQAWLTAQRDKADVEVLDDSWAAGR